MEHAPSSQVQAVGRRRKKRGAGEGSMYQRSSDKLWIGKLMVGYRADGKPDVRSVSSKTQAGCRRRLDELRQKLTSGFLSERQAEREAVADFLVNWLETTRTSVRHRTYRTYSWIVRIHLIPGLGRHRLSTLKPDHIQRFYADKLASGLAPRTVRHCHAVLHRALEQAVRWGRMPRNLCDAVDPPRVPRREMALPSPEDLARFLDEAEEAGDRFAALWTTAVHSGCRKGELLGLQWADLNLQAGTLAVRRALIATKGGIPRYDEPKSAQSRRTITLDPDAIATLQRHRARQDADRNHLGDGWANLDLVFASQIGTPLDQGNVSRHFKAALKRAGLSTAIRFHDLRHANATMMVRAGTHAKAISARLGHSQISITMDLYAHTMLEMDAEAASKLAGVLRQARKRPDNG